MRVGLDARGLRVRVRRGVSRHSRTSRSRPGPSANSRKVRKHPASKGVGGRKSASCHALGYFGFAELELRSGGNRRRVHGFRLRLLGIRRTSARRSLVQCALDSRTVRRSRDAVEGAVWVSPSGSDTTCARGNASKPCATLAGAYKVAKSGDTVRGRIWQLLACRGRRRSPFDSSKVNSTLASAVPGLCQGDVSSGTIQAYGHRIRCSRLPPARATRSRSMRHV